MKKNFYYKITIISFILLFSKSVYALYINSDISSMDSGEEFFSKPYINDTKKTNLYAFSAYKIDMPGSSEHGQPIQNGEIIFTPLKKILLPGEQEFFKIFYRGNKDDTERYYKITISETSLEITDDDNKNKKPLFYPTVSLETYFVVRPLNPKFTYEFEKQNGSITNTGNTYFRVLIHKSCEVDENEVPLVLYLLPKQEFRNELLKSKSRKYIVIFNKYYSIGNCD